MPLRYCIVMFSEYGSLWPIEKVGAEGVDLEMRSTATHVELSHPLVVDLRLTGRVDRHLKRLTRLFVQKLHHNVEHAHTGAVLTNNSLRDLIFLFEQGEPILRFQKLLLQGIGIRTIRGGYLLAKIFRLCLQGIARRSGRTRVCVKRAACLLGPTQKIILRL